MKKVVNKLVVLLLALIMPFNFVACSFSEFLEEGEEIIGDIGSDIEDWWQNTSVSFAEWWGDESVELDEWWDEACLMGGDILDSASKKFNEVSQSMQKGADKVKDSVIESLARVIYNNQNSSKNPIAQSDRTFSSIATPVWSGDEPYGADIRFEYDDGKNVYYDSCGYEYALPEKEINYIDEENIYIDADGNCYVQVVRELDYIDGEDVYIDSDGYQYTLVKKRIEYVADENAYVDSDGYRYYVYSREIAYDSNSDAYVTAAGESYFKVGTLSYCVDDGVYRDVFGNTYSLVEASMRYDAQQNKYYDINGLAYSSAKRSIWYSSRDDRYYDSDGNNYYSAARTIQYFSSSDKYYDSDGNSYYSVPKPLYYNSGSDYYYDSDGNTYRNYAYYDSASNRYYGIDGNIYVYSQGYIYYDSKKGVLYYPNENIYVDEEFGYSVQNGRGYYDSSKDVWYDGVGNKYTNYSGSIYYNASDKYYYSPRNREYFDIYGHSFYDGRFSSNVCRYYNSSTGIYYDTSRGGLYTLSGSAYRPVERRYYDSQNNIYYDPIDKCYYTASGSRYYDSKWDMYYDSVNELYFDPDCNKYYDVSGNEYYNCNWDRYYNEERGLYYDPAQSKYYDIGGGEYIDPNIGRYYSAVNDLYYDAAENMFYDADGNLYIYPYADMYYSAGEALYYDPAVNQYYRENGDVYYDSFEGMYYSLDRKLYYDPIENRYYKLNGDEHYELENPFVGMYYSSSKDLYYDPIENRYYESNGDEYRDFFEGMYYSEDNCIYYDPENNLFYNEWEEIYSDIDPNKYYNFKLEIYYNLEDGICYYLDGSVYYDPNQEENYNPDQDMTYDQEAFVYRLIVSLLPNSYDAFAGKVISQETGEEIIGIAYTDYSQGYKTDDGKTYYLTGFVSLPGEDCLTKKDLNDCLEIVRVDTYQDDNTGYLFAYQPESYRTHCVALGQYIVFGIDDAQITYEMVEYSPQYTYVDYNNLGYLYTFDENKIIKQGCGDSYFTASECMAQIAYETRTVDQIKADLYKEIGSVSIDFSSVNIKDIFNSVKSSVLSIFNKNGIVSNIAQLSLADVFSTEMFSPQSATAPGEFEKWIVGTCCVLTVIISIGVSLFVPQLSTVMMAISGVVSEAFVEVVFENRSLQSVDLRKVAIAGIAGAVSAKMGLMGDAVVGGVTEAVFGLLDGYSFGNAIESFANGCVIGVGFGVAFQGLSKMLGGIIDAISPNLRKNVASFISDHQIMIGGKAARVSADVADDSLKATARKAADKPSLSIKSFKQKVEDLAYNQLPRVDNDNFEYYTKKMIKSSNKEMDGYLRITDKMDPEIIKYFVNPYTGDPVDIIKLNRGYPNFTETAYFEGKINNMTSVRSKNFRAGDELAASVWRSNPDKMPEACKNYFMEVYGWTAVDDFAQLRWSHIAEMRSGKNLALTWHELPGGVMQLVPTAVNAAISHQGGRSVMEVIEATCNSKRLTHYVNRFYGRMV